MKESKIKRLSRLVSKVFYIPALHSFADLEDSSTNMYASPIAFEPAFMDFKSQ